LGLNADMAGSKTTTTHLDVGGATTLYTYCATCNCNVCCKAKKPEHRFY
jgi:hypothetical protein